MYRIELTPGEVTVFRTIDELATGVRNGVITSKARIYHGASEKWLPIEFHPHYKQALELLAGRSSDTHAPKQVERPRSEGLVFLNVPISPITTLPPMPATRAPTSVPVAPPIEASPVPAQAVHVGPADPPALMEEEPAADEPPVEESPVHDLPVHDMPVDHLPVHESPVHEFPGYQSSAHVSPVDDSPADGSRVERSPAHRSMVDHSPAHLSRVDHPPAHVSAVRVPPVKAPVLEDLVVVEAPRTRPTLEELFAPPASPRTPALPPVSTSPVLELPKISYPEFTPADAPVVEGASGGQRAKRPLHLVGAVLLLAAGGYASTMVFPFGRNDGGFTAASTLAERPIVPVRIGTSHRAAPVAKPRAAELPSAPAAPPPAVSSAPKPNAAPAPGPTDHAPLPPASSGFAPALEPRAIVAAPARSAPASDLAVDSTAVTPPAIDMEVAVPTLQTADSLAGPPRPKGDSAMKRILRAVGGRKDLP